jgi:hypothetical protein
MPRRSGKLAQRILKKLPKPDGRVFPAYEPKNKVIRKLVMVVGRKATFIAWRTRSRPGCKSKVAQRRTAGSCSITRTQGR